MAKIILKPFNFFAEHPPMSLKVVKIMYFGSPSPNIDFDDESICIFSPDLDGAKGQARGVQPSKITNTHTLKGIARPTLFKVKLSLEDVFDMRTNAFDYERLRQKNELLPHYTKPGFIKKSGLPDIKYASLLKSILTPKYDAAWVDSNGPFLAVFGCKSKVEVLKVIPIEET